MKNSNQGKGLKSPKSLKNSRQLSHVLVLMLLITLLTSTFAFGAEFVNLKISQTGGYFATQGDINVPLQAKVANNGNSKISFTPSTGLSQSSGAITEPYPNTATITLEPGQSVDLVFSITISGTATTGDNTIDLRLIGKGDKDGQVLQSKTLTVSIGKKITAPVTGNPDNYLPAMDLVYSVSPQEYLSPNADNKLKISFVNRGNHTMYGAIVTLTLPEGIFVKNTASSFAVGHVSVSDSKTVEFPLLVSQDLESKYYPVTITISFRNILSVPSALGGSSQSINDQSIEQIIYLPVQGSGASGSISGLAISDINLPSQINAGDSFTLNFKVGNKGDSGTGQLKIYAEAEGDILNRTQKTFVESNIASGDSKTYSVTFMTKDSTPESAYTIKIGTESVSGGKDGVFQYASVYVRNQGSDSIKTPQLMVESYSYGGSHVQAGDEFKLDLVLRNTSSAHVLRNIKLTLESPDGTFVPVRSSNSFFIDRIGKSSGVGKTMYLSVSPDADQKTTSLNISMSYEDSEGNSFTANDVVSIPVMQDTRLVVEEILSPPEVYVGMQSSASVDFYNMGKTKLNNLRINASGDFDVYESNSYYVGNMEPGTEDSYDFAFIPRDVGLMRGKIIFTYEDASGHEQNIEKDFEFSVMEMPIWDEEDMFPPDDMNGGGGFSWPILLAVLVVLAVGGFVAFRIIRKRKMQKELEIDEY